MTSIILSKDLILEPDLRKIQIRKRKDGEHRYVCNLPKNFMDRLIKQYSHKKGIYSINCIRLIIIDGELFLEIDESREMI